MVNNTINNITEIWKPLDEFPQYSVSNIGRIKNNKTGYVLVGGYDRDKYRQVTITCNGKQYNSNIGKAIKRGTKAGGFHWELV